MADLPFVLACSVTLLASSVASGAIVEHSFSVNNLTVSRLCRNQSIIVVNGCYPGPTIHARNGDTLIVHVLNQSPYNITIHWHGIFKLLSTWADEAAYVTQCPISPRQSFTYKFNIGSSTQHSNM
nr:laccase-7-like [Malus domestica]